MDLEVLPEEFEHAAELAADCAEEALSVHVDAAGERVLGHLYWLPPRPPSP